MPNIAKVGEVKEVANGYALNYLIPQQIAKAATTKNVEQAAKKQVRQAARHTANTVDTSQILEALKGMTLTFTGKVDQTGTLFAGISK